MWHTEVILWPEYNLYKVFYNGVLMGEIIEKADLKHALSDILQDVRRAEDMGYRDDKVSLHSNGENMHD